MAEVADVTPAAPVVSNSVSNSVSNTPAPVSSVKVISEFSLKVGGKVQDLELTDSEISTRLQKAMGAEKAFQEAAEERKKKAAFDEAFKKDPFSAAKEYGLDLDQLAEERLIRRFQEEELKKQDPAAFERQQLQKQVDEYRAREESAKQEAHQKAQAEYDAKIGQQLEAEFQKALDTSGLPKDRRFVRAMAEVFDINLEHGVELTADQCAAEVGDRIREEHQYVTKTLKGDALMKHLGDDVVAEVVKYHIAKFKPKQSVATPPGSPPGTAPGTELDEAGRPPRHMKSGQFLRKMQKGI